MTHVHTFIRDFSDTSAICGAYIINDIQLCKTRAGNQYLRATLRDAFGMIGMVFWDYDGELTSADNGAIVDVVGMVGTYRDALQLCVEQLAPADLSTWDAEDLAALVPSAPIDVSAYCTYVANLVRSIALPDLREICDCLLTSYWDHFCVIPAGKSVHHAFLHGLLMHTVDMAVVAETVAANNKGTVNRDLLIAGVLLHDIGKVIEFETSPLTGLVTGYSKHGNLMGHSVLGALLIAQAAEDIGTDPECSMLLQHMLLSHHGDPASGAAKVPLTIEAEILHDLDMLDSRKQIYAENLLHVQPHDYSPYIPALERRIYHHGLTEYRSTEPGFSDQNVFDGTDESAEQFGGEEDDLDVFFDTPPYDEDWGSEYVDPPDYPNDTYVPCDVADDMTYQCDPYMMYY